MRYALLAALALSSLRAQIPTILNTAPQPTSQEQQDLMKAVNDGSTSANDLVRAFELYLAKYPLTGQRAEIEYAIAKAAIELNDEPRAIQYGERVLARTTDDILMLNGVSGAMIHLGDKSNAEKILKYARHMEDIVDAMKVEPGRNAAQMQEDRDRAIGRMLLYQSRARNMLGQLEASERLAARAYSAYPDVASSKEWAMTLLDLGKRTEAVAHFADAFAIPDARATDSDRLKIRLDLGDLYKKLNGSEKGLGDEILAAYDRTSVVVELRKKKLMGLDPNSAVTSPLEYTVSTLGEKRVPLSDLKGKIVVLDFWATWCAPCRIQHPMYEELKKHYAKRDDIVFLALDTDEERNLVGPFVAEEKWDASNIYFDDGLSRLLQVSQIPTTILFNKAGRLSSRMNGFLPEGFVEAMVERIDAALAEK